MRQINITSLAAIVVLASSGPVTAEIDVELYEQRSCTIFREFAESVGVDPDGMVDHLENIPREMVMIVKRDPTVLESYESFMVALPGPR